MSTPAAVTFDRYTMNYAGLSAGTTRTGDRGDGGWYEGVLRDGKTVAWRCGHSHKTRDQSYPTRPSARDCAMAELQRRATAERG